MVPRALQEQIDVAPGCRGWHLSGVDGHQVQRRGNVLDRPSDDGPGISRRVPSIRLPQNRLLRPHVDDLEVQQ